MAHAPTVAYSPNFSFPIAYTCTVHQTLAKYFLCMVVSEVFLACFLISSNLILGTSHV